MKTLFILFFWGCLLNSCGYNGHHLVLKEGRIEKQYEIDTLEVDKSRGIYILGVTINKPFGKFKYFYSILKKQPNSQQIVYTVEDSKFWPRLSKEYIAITKAYPDAQWGWFFIQNGTVQKSLPQMNRLIDSLKSTRSSNLFVQEANGEIRFMLQGKLVEKFNYGNLITKDNALNFDSLDYKLYRLEGDILNVVSENGNELFEQKDGIYYIPSPGYGVIGKFRKDKVFAIIDSISYLKTIPGTIIIKD